MAAAFFESAIAYRSERSCILTCRAFLRLSPIEMPHLQRTGAPIRIKKISSDQRDRQQSAKSFRHSSIGEWALKGVGTMSKRNGLPVGAAIGFVVGLFAGALNDSAYAASGCLTAPNRESGPNTHWNYRINQTTQQRCWYLKKVGGQSRPRPTAVAHATRARVTREVAATTSRAAPVEVAAPAENDSPIKSWFSATFGALSGSSSPTTEMREPAANEPPPPRKRRVSTAERTESKAARAQQLPATAKEATEDKDVATPSDQQSEWQKALYEEFLQWRVKQLMFQ
jgi:hypothetical protein